MTAGIIEDITLGAAGVWTLVALMIGALVKAWPALRKLQNESDVSLRGDLMKRVSELEKQVVELAAKLEQERARHAVEMHEERESRVADAQIVRHQLNNETQSLDALLLLLKTSPEKVPEAVDLVMSMRADRATVLSQEKVAITQARIETAARRRNAGSGQ